MTSVSALPVVFYPGLDQLSKESWVAGWGRDQHWHFARTTCQLEISIHGVEIHHRVVKACLSRREAASKEKGEQHDIAMYPRMYRIQPGT